MDCVVLVALLGCILSDKCEQVHLVNDTGRVCFTPKTNETVGSLEINDEEVCKWKGTVQNEICCNILNQNGTALKYQTMYTGKLYVGIGKEVTDVNYFPIYSPPPIPVIKRDEFVISVTNKVLSNFIIYEVISHSTEKLNCTELNNHYKLLKNLTSESIDLKEFEGKTIVPCLEYEEQLQCSEYMDLRSTKNSSFGTAGIFFIVVLVLAVIAAILYVFVLRKRFEGIAEEPSDETEPLEVKQNSLDHDGIVNLLKAPDAVPVLKEEHQNIPNTMDEVYECADRTKDRNSNIKPYMKNRVILNRNGKNDYINASFAKGINQSKSYIATQAPTNETKADFWHMILENNVTVIVNLTALNEGYGEECYKYWPKKTEIYDQIKINCNSVKNYIDFVVRQFEVSLEDKTLAVTQFHYDTWGDHPYPRAPHRFVDFSRFVRNQTLNGPIVVHCSDGLNRTGSFILTDYIIDAMENFYEVNVANVLCRLRESRRNFVSNFEHYLLAHCAMLEYIDKSNVPYGALHGEDLLENTFADKLDQRIDEDLDILSRNSYWFNILYQYIRPHKYDCNKHRTALIPFTATNFLKLEELPNDPDSTYTSAILVKTPNIAGNFTREFIIVGHPVEKTVGDFWRLIDERNINTVIMIQRIQLGATKLYPLEENDIMRPVSHLYIKFLGYEDKESHDNVYFELNNDKHQNKPRIILLLNFKKWNYRRWPNQDDFLDLYASFLCRMDERTGGGFEGPVLLSCCDGVSGCGVFLTFYDALFRYVHENVIDICSTVRTLRKYEQHIMTDKEAYVFLYKLFGVLSKTPELLTQIRKDFALDS